MYEGAESEQGRVADAISEILNDPSSNMPELQKMTKAALNQLQSYLALYAVGKDIKQRIKYITDRIRYDDKTMLNNALEDLHKIVMGDHAHPIKRIPRPKL